MTVWEKIADFFANCTPTDWLFLGAIVLIPVISIVLLIVGAVNRKKQKKLKGKAEETVAEAVVETADPIVVEEPKKRTVRYINTRINPTEQVRVKVRVRNLCKVDRSLLVATGIFGVSLGMAVQRAFGRDCRR